MNSRNPLPPKPIDQLQIARHRGPLTRALQALKTGRLTVGFIGGSITEGWEHNWPGPVAAWFAGTYPEVFLRAENAAIGATGSDSACLRVDREIIQRECDLTFVEYAVNDLEKEPGRRLRTQEGLIRKLLAAGGDVVLVYTFRQEMYADMIKGVVPETIAGLEGLGSHYNIGSVWMGLHALNEVRAGCMKWSEWLPDGLHPTHRGSWSYGQAVIDFLGTELQGKVEAEKKTTLPEPLSPLNWQNVVELPLEAVRTSGPWILKRVHLTNHVGQILETHTPGASLEFDFEGRGLAMIFDYGKRSAEFNYRIDGGGWIPMVRERPDWGGDRGMVRALIIAEDLKNGPHTFEMEVTHGNRPDCTGTECRLAHIGVL